MKSALSNVLLGQETNSSRTELICYALISLAIWGYLVLRSIYIPLVYDEAVTFEAYMQLGSFMPPDAYWDANNHFLNSIAGWLNYKVFGFSFWSIRLWNLLTFPIYSYFSYRIGDTLFPSRTSRWLFFLAMVCTPFTIEFFGLARGYGGSLAFFMAFIFYVIKASNTPQSISAFLLILGSATLSVMCNFSIIIGVFLASSFLFIKHLLDADLKISSIIIRGILLMLAMTPWAIWILELKNRGLLYYGGKEIIPFFLSPMGSMFLRNEQLWYFMLIPFIWGALVLISRVLNSGIKSIIHLQSIFSFTLVLGLILIVSLQLLLNLNYPEDRAALYFFPLMVGALSEKLSVKGYPAFSPTSLLLVWPIIDLASTANLTHSRLWRTEHITDAFYKQIEFLETDPPTISGYRLREVNWQYGQFNQTYQSSISSESFPTKWAKYLFSSDRFKQDHPNVPYDTVYIDPITDQYLLKRKEALLYTPIKDTVIDNLITRGEYVNIFDFPEGKVPLKPLRFHASFKANPSQLEIPVTLLLSASDTNGNMFYYEKHNLQWCSNNWGNSKAISVTEVLEPLDQSAQRLVIYLYNPKKVEYSFDTISAKLEIIAEN